MVREQRCAACINSFASADICKIIIISPLYLFFIFDLESNICITFDRELQLCSHTPEQSKLRRDLHLIKECRDVATAIHLHYAKMYPGGICQMSVPSVRRTLMPAAGVPSQCRPKTYDYSRTPGRDSAASRPMRRLATRTEKRRGGRCSPCGQPSQP